AATEAAAALPREDTKPSPSNSRPSRSSPSPSAKGKPPPPSSPMPPSPFPPRSPAQPPPSPPSPPPPRPPSTFAEYNVVGGIPISLRSIEEFPWSLSPLPSMDLRAVFLIRVRATDTMVNFSVPMYSQKMYSKAWEPIDHWVTLPPDMFHAPAVSGFGGNRIAIYVLSSLIT
ncbi:hypothetical protein Vretifemale_10593, partial [Volvox reticuliferus]